MFYRRRAHNASPRIRVKLYAVSVKSYFEAAIFNIRERVRQVRMHVMKPHRHARSAKVTAARGRAEKEHLLPGGKDALPQQLRKYFRQPGTTSKDKCAGRDGISSTGLDFSKLAGATGRKNGRHGIINSILRQLTD